MRTLAAKGLIAILALASFLALNTGQALATHVSCGDTITQDTTLDSDLIDCPSEGIVIGAENVTLDLNGHTIDAADGNGRGGVVNGGFEPETRPAYDGVTVTGGTVRDFNNGIDFARASRNAIRGLTLAHNREGVFAKGLTASRIESNSVSDSTLGIFLAGGFGNAVRGNSVSGGFNGISVSEEHSLIEKNSLSGNFAGVNLECLCFGTRVRRNRVFNNVYGLRVGEEGDHVAVEKNVVIDNEVGIWVSDTFDATVEGNLVADNAEGIVLVASARQNLVANNVISGNSADGIFVGQENPRNLIERNLASRNGDDGIDIREPTTTVARNRANRNGDLGIEAVPGVIDGGGNRAFGNGNPLQCLNVECK